MKKIILTLGSIGIIATPITTLVSCGDSKKSTNNTTDNTTPTINIDDKISNLINNLSDNVISTKFDATLSSDVASLAVDATVEPTLVGLPTDFLTLEDGMSASYTVNTIYDATTHAIKLNLKISATSDSNISSTKIITIKGKYDFSTEKVKFIDKTSSKTATTLTHDASGLTNLTPTILGFTPPTLSNGVTATYSIDDANFTSTTAKTVTVHLTYGDQTDTTTFNLTPYILTINDKISNLINKLSDNVISTKLDATLSTDVASLAVDAVVQPTLVGLPTDFLTLEDGMSVSYTVNTAYDATTHAIKLNLKISATSDSNISSTKIITIKGKYDFSTEKAKFTDKTSTKVTSKLIAGISSVNNITDQELGITTPSLADGVTVTYSMADKIFTSGSSKAVTAHLSHDGQTDITTFNLRPNTFEISSIAGILLGGQDIWSIVSDGHDGFFVGGKDGNLDLIDIDGNLVSGWTTKTLLGGVSIYSMISDGNGGFFVGGNFGKLDHIDANGDLVDDWSTKTLLGGSPINSIISDGYGGFWVGGDYGKLDHIDANGDLVDDWSTKTLLLNTNVFITIRSIVLDGSDDGGAFVVGSGLDHIDGSGNLVNGWTTKTLLGKNEYIYSMVSDGNGGYFVGGQNGNLDHIDANGNLVHGWTTKALLGGSGNNIWTIISDGNAGFWVGGDNGKLDHIDVNGNLIDDWSTKTLLGGSDITSMVSDGHNGFWVGGDGGKLNHFIYEP